LDPASVEKARSIVSDTLQFSFDAEQAQAVSQDDGVAVSFTDLGKIHSEHFDFLLVTTGRRPNLFDLRLEHVGVTLDKFGYPEVDRHTAQIGSSHIFMAGDVTHDMPVLHEAADNGRIAGDSAGISPDVLVVYRVNLRAVGRQAEQRVN
jgi:dihydrolipoamide dehydrogenase